MASIKIPIDVFNLLVHSATQNVIRLEAEFRGAQQLLETLRANATIIGDAPHPVATPFPASEPVAPPFPASAISAVKPKRRR